MSATFKKSGSATATLKSRKLTREHDYRCTEVQVYEGSIDDLKALGKSVGDAFVTVDGGNTVYTRTLEYETHANGPVSRLVVTATNWTSGGGSTTDTDYELEWMRVDKDIRSHPKFLSGGANALTSSDWSKVVEWEAETNADKKLALYNALGVNPGMLAYRLQIGRAHV